MMNSDVFVARWIIAGALVLAGITLWAVTLIVTRKEPSTNCGIARIFYGTVSCEGRWACASALIACGLMVFLISFIW